MPQDFLSVGTYFSRGCNPHQRGGRGHLAWAIWNISSSNTKRWKSLNNAQEYLSSNYIKLINIKLIVLYVFNYLERERGRDGLQKRILFLWKCFKKINWYRQNWLAVVGRSPAAKSFFFCRHLPILLAGTPVGRISSRLRVVFTMCSAVEDINDQIWMWPCCPQDQVFPLVIGHFFNMSLERTQGWKIFQTLTSWVKQKHTVNIFTSRFLCLLARASTALSPPCRSLPLTGDPPLLLSRPTAPLDLPLPFTLPSSSSNRAWCRACVACVSERTGITTNLKIIKNK